MTPSAFGSLSLINLVALFFFVNCGRRYHYTKMNEWNYIVDLCYQGTANAARATFPLGNAGFHFNTGLLLF